MTEEECGQKCMRSLFLRLLLALNISPFLRLAKSRLRRLLACTRLRAQSSVSLTAATFPPGGRGAERRRILFRVPIYRCTAYSTALAHFLEYLHKNIAL